ncbi:SMI1/KNR4 family protein [Oceanobacillus timonensis]|uniref:SMI1/KNR4 family protein n=1 Tax=Oceanobacillus timonensis TaxID=1926285 RepID=UPI0009BAC7B1|nr:SMI1/KNR4 family protein [Oceanobacillus timonensis]
MAKIIEKYFTEYSYYIYATLVAGDFICLDYRNSVKEPIVCVWNHEESSDLNPVTYFVSNNFEEFLKTLTV